MIFGPLRELVQVGKTIVTEFAYVVLYDAEDFIVSARQWLDKQGR